MASTYALITIFVLASLPGIVIASGVLAFGAANPRDWSLNSSRGVLSMTLGILYIVYLTGFGAIVAMLWPSGTFPIEPARSAWSLWVFVGACVAALLLEVIFFNDPKRIAPRGTLMFPLAVWAAVIFWRSNAA